jgi:hypothetical protein
VSFEEATGGTKTTRNRDSTRINPEGGGSPEGLPNFFGGGGVDDIIVDRRGDYKAGQGKSGSSDESCSPHFG